jgi:transposase
MLIKTLLNKIEHYKSFVYRSVYFGTAKGTEALIVEIKPRTNAQPECIECGQRYNSYDTQPSRFYEYVPLWGIRVFFRYSPRRVLCSVHGVHVERLPWAQGKEQMTTTYKVFLARWAKRLSWKETAEVFKSSWDSVYRAVQYVVEYGLANRNLENVAEIGVDELQVFHGHKYLTLVYQLDAHCKRLLWCGSERRVTTLLRFFREFGKERSRAIKFVCSDMWAPYLKVIKKKAPNALNILDRFHVMKKFNEAIDQIRRDEVKAFKKTNKENVLEKGRWLLLKRPENLNEKQTARLSEIMKLNLSSVKGYLMREDFQRFWEYKYPACAEKFLENWITRTLKTNLEPMKKVAKMLRKHQTLILNWFQAKGRLSSGTVEGFNLKAKLTMRKAFGFKSEECLKIALYHTLGNLPDPLCRHRFSG